MPTRQFLIYVNGCCGLALGWQVVECVWGFLITTVVTPCVRSSHL